jgi:hypothetical protein
LDTTSYQHDTSGKINLLRINIDLHIQPIGLDTLDANIISMSMREKAAFKAKYWTQINLTMSNCSQMALKDYLRQR